LFIGDEVKKRVLEKVDSLRNEVIEFLRQMVQIPSLSGTPEEGRVQRLVAEKLEGIEGMEIDVWEPRAEDLERYPLYPIRLGSWSYENRPNVVGILKGAKSGKSLILNGHVDVVSSEPASAWTHDPWGAEIEGGKLYGRGSTDMKGGLAAMIYAVLAVQQAGVKLKGKVILESVVEEEYGGGGTIAAIVRGYSADGAIITEPTDANAICIGAGGSRFFTVKISGKPEWPHLAHYGVNAIGLALKVYNALLDLDAHREKMLRGKHALFEALRSGGMRGPGRPTNLTLGVLRAGDWPATVAGWAELQGRVGFPPSEKGEDVAKQFEEAVRRAAEQDTWMRDHPPLIKWWGPRREGYELAPENPLVQTVKRYIEETVGPCDLFASPSAADGSYLATRVGAYGGIPTIWYGPGGSSAHSFDEYVRINDVMAVIKVLALSVIDLCGYEI